MEGSNEVNVVLVPFGVLLDNCKCLHTDTQVEAGNHLFFAYIYYLILVSIVDIPALFCCLLFDGLLLGY